MSDTERLDWREAHPDRPVRSMRFKGLWLHWVMGCDEDAHPTIRQAIDAAIEAEKKKENK